MKTLTWCCGHKREEESVRGLDSGKQVYGEKSE